MSDDQANRIARLYRMMQNVRRRSGRVWKEAVERGRMVEALLEERARLMGPAAHSAAFPDPFAPIEIKKEQRKSHGTIVAFSSLQMTGGLVQKSFATFLSGRGARTVFVKDFHRKWFQNGLPPAAATRDEAVSLLADVLADAPRPWRFIGVSAGGFGALFFGARLKADRIVAVCPQTEITPQIYARFQQPTPNDGVYDYDDPQNDLYATLVAHPLEGEAIIVYGRDNRIDSDQAERLRSLSGVSLRPQPTRAHSALGRHVIDSGQMEMLTFQQEPTAAFAGEQASTVANAP